MVAMVENTVDPTTGMVTVRGLMGNESELLWPGILVNTRLTIRTANDQTISDIALSAVSQIREGN